MTENSQAARDFSDLLLPQQTAFVNDFFNTDSKRNILLRADVGLGKTTALVALASRFLVQQPSARVLFLAPGTLGAQFVEMLRTAGTDSMAVDRYRLRELLETSSEGELWPVGKPLVLGQDFAKQSDVLEWLVQTHWDLVIVDEGHRLTGRRGEAVKRIAASAERVVIAIRRDLQLPERILTDDVQVVDWRREEFVGRDGALLDVIPRPLLKCFQYELTPDETALGGTIGQLCELLGGTTGYMSWTAQSLLRSFQSSPAALEGSLRRIVEKVSLSGDGEESVEPFEETPLSARFDSHVAPAMQDDVIKVSERALQQTEKLTTDSKLVAFVSLLEHLRSQSARVCVLTEFSATLFYLATEMEDRDTKCHIHHGALPHDERQHVLLSFINDGGVLVSTSGSMNEGIQLSKVTDLVFYDMVRSKVALQEVIGRFDRLGRSSQLKVYALTAVEAGDPNFGTSHNVLREHFGQEVTIVQGQS